MAELLLSQLAKVIRPADYNVYKPAKLTKEEYEIVRRKGLLVFEKDGKKYAVFEKDPQLKEKLKSFGFEIILNTDKVIILDTDRHPIENPKHLNIAFQKALASENMECMFYDCRQLISLDLSSFDTSSVTDMRRMFYDCNSLTSLDLSNFITSKVKNMTYMFNGCKSLTSLDLSSFDTSSVTDMEGMFMTCTHLKLLDLSNFNTSKVRCKFAMFYGCKNLKEVITKDKGIIDQLKFDDINCRIIDPSQKQEVQKSSFFS